MSVLFGARNKLPIGTVVQSVAVGRKGRFVGTITSYAAHGDYNVTDKNGNGWHRSRNEIYPIDLSKSPEPVTPPKQGS